MSPETKLNKHTKQLPTNWHYPYKVIHASSDSVKSTTVPYVQQIKLNERTSGCKWPKWKAVLDRSLIPSSTPFPSWQCDSVVKTSVFGWQTFPNICLIYSWHVTTSLVLLWAFRVGKWVVIHVITWIIEVETINGRQGCVWTFVVGQSLWEQVQTTACRLFAYSVCNIQRCCSCRLWRYISVVLSPLAPRKSVIAITQFISHCNCDWITHIMLCPSHEDKSKRQVKLQLQITCWEVFGSWRYADTIVLNLISWSTTLHTA